MIVQKKLVLLHSYLSLTATSPQRSLSSMPRVGHYREVRLYVLWLWIGSFNKQWWKQRQQERQKKVYISKSTTLHSITDFFVHFFIVTTTTWKCLFSRFVEDVNTRQRLSFSFPELWFNLIEFISRKNCQHLTNWTRWNEPEWLPF